MLDIFFIDHEVKMLTMANGTEAFFQALAFTCLVTMNRYVANFCGIRTIPGNAIRPL